LGEEFQYITYPASRRALQNDHNCIVIDPGRRDILFCMHESSTADNPNVYRFTSNNLATDSSRRRYRKFREALLEANPEISVAFDRLSMVNKKQSKIISFFSELHTKRLLHRHTHR
jgi:hypothetical protein